MFIFCDFLSRYLQLKHYRYILLQSDSEQRLIGTKWKQQDGGCEDRSNQRVCTRGRLQHCGLINTSHKHVYIDSNAAEVPFKFQSDWTILTANLAASRLHEILQTRCLIGYSGVLNSRTYRNKWTPGKICRKTISRTPVLHYICRNK